MEDRKDIQNDNLENSKLVPLVGRIPFPAYRGEEPYIFISYAHVDQDLVFPIIKQFYDHGYHIWYDEGIAPGNEWTDEIADALAGASLFLVFMTPDSESSINCRDEINFAINDNMPFLAIHLKPTELTGGLKLRVGTKQAILKYNMSDEEFLYKYTFAFENLGLPVPEAILEYKNKYTAATRESATANMTEIPAHKAVPKTVQAGRYSSIAPKGTAVITDASGRTYTAPANSLFSKAGQGISQGIRTRMDSKTELPLFKKIARLTTEKYPNDTNKLHRLFHIRETGGSTYDLDIQSSFSLLSFFSENKLVTVNWSDVAEIDIDWSKSCLEKWPGFARVHMKNGDIVMMPDFALTLATRKKPAENSLSCDWTYEWPDRIKTERGYDIKLDELSSMSFGNVIRKKDRWSDDWIEDLPLCFSFRDGRQLSTRALADWLLLLGQDEFGVIEIKPEKISHIDFVSDIAEEVYVPDAPLNSDGTETGANSERLEPVKNKAVAKNIDNKHPVGDYVPAGTATVELKDGTVVTGIANSFVLMSKRMENRTMGNETLYTGLDTPDIEHNYELTDMMQFLEMEKLEYGEGEFKAVDSEGDVRYFTLPDETQFWFITEGKKNEPEKIDVHRIRSIRFDRSTTPDFPIRYCNVYCKEGWFRSPACFLSVSYGSPGMMKFAHGFSAFTGFPMTVKNLVGLDVTKQGADGSMFAPPRPIELTARMNTGEDIDFTMDGYFSIIVMGRFGRLLNISRSSFCGIEFEKPVKKVPTEVNNDSPVKEEFYDDSPEDARKRANGDLVCIDGFDIEHGLLRGYYGTDKNITVPRAAKIIGTSSFDRCRLFIESVDLNQAGKIIAGPLFGGFRNCPNLKTVKIPETVDEVRPEMFHNCPNLTIYVHRSQLSPDFEKHFTGKDIVYLDE